MSRFPGPRFAQSHTPSFTISYFISAYPNIFTTTGNYCEDPLYMDEIQTKNSYVVYLVHAIHVSCMGWNI
jgi:hypothetical protein